jgi:dihydroorotate dehydrogenase (fumarate)
VRRAKQAVAVPIIGSLNGVSTGGWIEFAKKIQQAGADAFELNIFYVPTDPALTAAQVERMYVDLVRDVKAGVSIPVAVKLGPAFSALANLARHLDVVGADGLVLFNRFYLPDFDLERLEVTPRLALSHPHELLLRLHWVALLHGHVKADLAVTGGVHGSAQVLKSMMAGARVAMMTSALLEHGIRHLGRVRGDLLDWMEAHEYASIMQMQGTMSYRSVAEPAAFERANYMKVLSSRRACGTGCASAAMSRDRTSSSSTDRRAEASSGSPTSRPSWFASNLTSSSRQELPPPSPPRGRRR